MSSQSIPYSQLVSPGPCSSSGRKRFHSPSRLRALAHLHQDLAGRRPPGAPPVERRDRLGLDRHHVLVHELADALAQFCDAVRRSEIHASETICRCLIPEIAIGIRYIWLDHFPPIQWSTHARLAGDRGKEPGSAPRRAARAGRLARPQALARPLPRRRRRPQLPGALPRRSSEHLADPLGPDRRHRLPRPRPLRRRRPRDPRPRPRGAPESAAARRRASTARARPSRSRRRRSTACSTSATSRRSPCTPTPRRCSQMGAYMVEPDGTLTRHSIDHTQELRPLEVS